MAAFIARIAWTIAVLVLTLCIMALVDGWYVVVRHDVSGRGVE